MVTTSKRFAQLWDFKNSKISRLAGSRPFLQTNIPISEDLDEGRFSSWNDNARARKYRWMSRHKHRQTDKQINRQTVERPWLSTCVYVGMCVYDHVRLCVSFQSAHASVPLIILIWRCLLLACLVGDKAEGLSLSHSVFYYGAGWAAQGQAQLPCSQAISLEDEKKE